MNWYINQDNVNVNNIFKKNKYQISEYGLRTYKCKNSFFFFFVSHFYYKKNSM